MNPLPYTSLRSCVVARRSRSQRARFSLPQDAAQLSPGPEWVTGYPELDSDRTPLARAVKSAVSSLRCDYLSSDQQHQPTF